jgi:hypothetical protein
MNGAGPAVSLKGDSSAFSGSASSSPLQHFVQVNPARRFSAVFIDKLRNLSAEDIKHGRVTNYQFCCTYAFNSNRTSYVFYPDPY